MAASAASAHALLLIRAMRAGAGRENGPAPRRRWAQRASRDELWASAASSRSIGTSCAAGASPRLRRMQRQQVERPIPRSKPAGLPARPVGQGARILMASCVTLARRQDARRVRARLAPRGTGRRIAQRTPRPLLCVPAERCCAPTSQRRARVAPRRRFDRARLHAAHQERTVHRTALSAAALAIHEHYDDAAEHDGQRRRDAALQRCRLSRAARHASLRHGCSPAARASALHAAAAREAACSPARHAPLPRAMTARAKRRTTPGSPAQQGAGGRGWADHRELYRGTAQQVRTHVAPPCAPAGYRVWCQPGPSRASRGVVAAVERAGAGSVGASARVVP